MPELDCNIRCKLRDFTLEFDFSGELQGVQGIFGPSGSGKTTLLRILAGLSKNQGTHLRLDGVDWHSKAQPKQTPSHLRKVAYLSQQPFFFHHLSPYQNLVYGYKRRKTPTGCQHSKKTPEECIELLGLGEILERSIGNLSGGEQQKLALARAVLLDSRLWLIDEPFSALDQQSKKLAMQVLRDHLRQTRSPAFYVSHSWSEMATLSDSLFLVEKGKFEVLQGHKKDHLGPNLLTALDSVFDEKRQVLTIQMAEHSYRLPGCKTEGAEKLLLLIRPDDIHLSLDKPVLGSQLDWLPAQIESLQEPDSGCVYLKLRYSKDSAVAPLTAQISALAADNMKLKVADQVFFNFKPSFLAASLV